MSASPVGIEPAPGLTTGEVASRVAAGQVNEVESISSRSVSSIVRANVLTRFNAIIAALAVIVLMAGQPIDALFGLVMVLNAGIGIGQELRAKHSLDRLTVLLVPEIEVRRDGTSVVVVPSQLVVDDVILLQAGEQVPVDGQVLTAVGLELDESVLTGESAPVRKHADDAVLGGSVVSAGSGTVLATAVGEAVWARQLTREAKKFELAQSELRSGIDRLLTVIGWILPPLALLLAWSQYRASTNVNDSVVAAVAGVVSLVPQGLVLLVSMAFAVGVTRLARRNVVVQELAALEILARVDVVCIDKTGTLTTGQLEVASISVLRGDRAATHCALAAMVESEGTGNATTEAIATAVGPITQPPWPLITTRTFSSVRKWSGISTTDHGTFLLGAPEILLDAMAGPEADTVRAAVGVEAGSGRRVVLLAATETPLPENGDDLPLGLFPLAIVSLEEQLRPDAAATVAYFAQEGVHVKVLSGDNPVTVSAVAAAVGVPGADQAIDTRHVTPDELRAAADATTIFGRVLPEQKRDVIKALRQAGRTVAMIGDGVNDIPALKAADLGIAMDTATPATRAVAQLVLLDGRFDHLPEVVAEGRRVVANMERISSLFVTKTVYSVILAIMVGVAGVAFPFLPRHLSIIGAVTIGIPAFALSFRPADARCRPGYLARVLRFSIPAGVVAAGATFWAYWVARAANGADLANSRSVATIVMTALGLWILYRLSRPLGRWEGMLVGGLVIGFALMFVPPFAHFSALSVPPPALLTEVTVSLALLIGVLQILLAFGERVGSGADVGAKFGRYHERDEA